MSKAHLFSGFTQAIARGALRNVRRAGTVVAGGLKLLQSVRASRAAALPKNNAAASAANIGNTSDASFSAAPERRVPGQNRHELSSLTGSHALAPDRVAIGEELVDPESLEVPLGISSDESFGPRLSHDKLPQPDTTGAALFDLPEVDGEGMEIVSLASSDDADTLTAQPKQRPLFDEEHYDAIPPESAGVEWLARATEAPSMDVNAGFDGNDISIADEFAGIATSEGTLQASLPFDEAIDETEETDEVREAREDGEQEWDWGRPAPDVLARDHSERR
jgi:hypothetical protein